MKPFVIAFAALLVSMSVLARGDFDAAAKAYRARHYSAAYQQFLLLAKAGNPRAQTVIAMMYKYGESVPQDTRRAFHWYLKAAKQDYGPALYQVGVMYAEGRGVKQDRGAAIEWLKRAQEAGFKRARTALAQLGAHTPPATGPQQAAGKDTRPWNFRLPNNVRAARTPASRLNPGASYRVELGSTSTREDAGRLWDALVQRAPDVLRNAEPLIRLAQHSDRRLYRVQTGPFNGLATALDFCKRLQREVQITCQPVTE